MPITNPEIEKVALDTLKELLTREQIKTLTRYTTPRSVYKNYFDFEAHGKKFRIYNRHLYAVREMDKKGNIVKSICSHRRLKMKGGLGLGYEYGSSFATVLNHYLEILYDYPRYLSTSAYWDGDYGTNQ